MATELPDAKWKRDLRRRLLRWFVANQRDLPWRRSRDPYRVWVSEIMLQQTQVATVIPYYERFLEAFPDVRKLAGADEEEVLRLWEGLGYYRRARQLHAAAKHVVAEHDGEFPEQFDSVLALPGVGRYTAGAILSIALDQRQPIVEANTIRLYSRLLAHRDDVTSSESQKRFWEFAEAILPRSGCGDFNQALMELGAEVCRPKSPRCDACPLRAQCPTFELAAQDEIPAPKKKQQFEECREAAVVVRKDNHVLLRLCGESERWTGLWDFPRFPVSQTRDAAIAAELREGVRKLTSYEVLPGKRLLQLKHGVTRFRITLDCYEAEFSGPASPPTSTTDLRWAPIAQLEETPLNTTGRKLARFLQQQAQ